MLQLKIALQLRSLPTSFRRALDVARQLNIDAVEIDARGEVNPQLGETGIRQVRKLLDDQGLRVAAVEFRTRRGYEVEEDLQPRVEATRAAMRLAYELGARVVVNQVGRVPADDKSPIWQRLTEVLADLGAYGQKVGAMLCTETGAESGADLRRLLEALPKGALGVTFDPGNLIVNGFSSQDAAQELAGWIEHVHVNDAVRDLARGRGMAVEIGRGAADFPALLGLLEERQYRGYLSIERGSVDNPALEVSQAVQYLRNL
ncbi:MAG: sugar phosphate isomerase/epimerase [Planctomycetes bacterium]|nr:sugar phosphate isomerase/epimerase [Planctomycetota bacterium]